MSGTRMNNDVMTVYLGEELKEAIEELATMSGMNRSRVVSAILRAALPHVKLVERRSYTFSLGRMASVTEEYDEEVEA